MNKLRQFFGKINREIPVLYDELMSKHTTFRIGGPADALVFPGTVGEFALILRLARNAEIPVFILGGGANLLVSDSGIRGIVVSTSRISGVRAVNRKTGSARQQTGADFFGSECRETGNTASERAEAARVTVLAGTAMELLCLECLSLGLAGFESFAGMPGSAGGAIFMNARCYDREIAQLSPEILCLDADSNLVSRPFVHEDWSYKLSPFQDGARHGTDIIMGAEFMLPEGNPAQIASVMRARRADREAKGHYRLPSAGSMFKNDRGLGRPTGAILDGLGLRGKRIGDALVSPWHANIFVNAGKARASDMAALVRLAQSEAERVLGVKLEPEVLFVGKFA